MNKRRFAITLLVLLLMLALPSVVLGQSSTNAQDQPTNVLHAFDQATQQWIKPMQGYANRLFMALAGIDMAWLGITLVLEGAEMQQTLAKVLKKVAVLGFWLAVLQNGTTWIGFIVNSFTKIGVTAGGLNGGLQPSEILYTGVQISSSIFAHFQFSLVGITTLIAGPGVAVTLIALFCGICVFLGYAIITITFIIAKIESYIALSGAYIFLGFGGSRWTTSYVERYLGLAIATGTRLMVLYLLIGLGNTLGQSWITMADNAGNLQNPEQNLLGLVAGVFTYMAVCWSAPKFISSMISGSISAGAGDLIAPAAAIGAGAATVAAAAVTGGAALAGLGAAGAAGAGGTLSAGGASAVSAAAAPMTEAATSAAVGPPAVGGGTASAAGTGGTVPPIGSNSGTGSPTAGKTTESASAGGDAPKPPKDGGEAKESSSSASQEQGGSATAPEEAKAEASAADSVTEAAAGEGDVAAPQEQSEEAESSQPGYVPPPSLSSSQAKVADIGKGKDKSSPEEPATASSASAVAPAPGAEGNTGNVTGESADSSSAPEGGDQSKAAEKDAKSGEDAKADAASKSSDSGQKKVESPKPTETATQTEPAKQSNATPDDKKKPLHETLHNAANSVRGARDEAQTLIQHLPQHETSASAPQLNIHHGE